MPRGRPSRFISQATQLALVKYGPEIAGLRELQRVAQQTYQGSVGSARSTAAGIIGAVDQARPGVAQIYDRAGLDQARAAHTLISHDLAALGPAADYLKAAGATEQAGAIDRLSQARAAALTDLSSRRVAAKEGQQWATRAARTKLVQDLTSILNRRQSLAREEGTYTSVTAQQLRDEANKLAQQLSIARGHDRTSRANTRAGIRSRERIAQENITSRQQIASMRAGPGGRKPASAAQRSRAAAQVGLALSTVRTLDPNRAHPRSAIGSLLTQGAKSQPVYETVRTPTGGTKRQVKLGPGGTPRMTPAVPKVDQIYVRVALDQYYYGYVKPNTIKALNRLGLRARDLPGVQIRPPRPAPLRRPGLAPGVGGQLRPT